MISTEIEKLRSISDIAQGFVLVGLGRKHWALCFSLAQINHKALRRRISQAFYAGLLGPLMGYLYIFVLNRQRALEQLEIIALYYVKRNDSM